MSNDLKDLLAKRANHEPPEFKQIRDFVQEKLGITPALAIRNDLIIISMPNSAAAGSLRFELHNLTKVCKTKKRLMIRIGS